MSRLKNKYGLFFLPIVVGILYGSFSYAGGNLLQLNGTGGHDAVVWQDFQLPITWHLSEDGLPNSSITNTELQAILQTAFDTWENVFNSEIDFTYGGLVSERISGIDGLNLITFTDNDYVFPENVLAFAISYTFLQDVLVGDTNNDLNDDGVPDLINGTYPAGTVYEADIVFNPSLSFDIHAVALHEIGHVIGLAHSIIQDTVMHPFLSSDINSLRILKADDVAYASYLYPGIFYNTSYGSLSGVVSNGLTGQPILGAHVFAVDPVTGNKTVGAYSLESGDYIIPGLTPGDYYIGIEPLDGEPLEADPKRINEVIKDTLDTDFVAEFYDANESNVEADPGNALAVAVANGVTVTDINIVTNTVDLPGVDIVLKAGLNLFSYPVETPIGFTAFDLVTAIGDASVINSVDRYNPDTGRFERALWSNGQLSGIDFDIHRGEGYLVHMNVQKIITFEGQQSCPLINIAKGFNLIGVPCPPAGYSAFDLLESIGPSAISVQKYDADTMSFQVASYNADGNPVGDDFVIANGVAYVAETLSDEIGVSLPGPLQIFPPFIVGVSPGRGVIGTQVMITGLGFSDDPLKNDVKFNGIQALVNYASGVQLVVTVPSGATTGPVTAAVAGKISNAMDFIVEPLLVSEVDIQGKDMVEGQTVQGNLDSNTEQDRYSFIVSKGASITATATSVITGVPDIMLFLEGPSGEVLTSDDNGAGGTNAKINRFEAGRTGRYTLVVAAKPDSGSGAYTLTLDIENTPQVAEITTLDGDYQTGLMGTQLPVPLEILVTGPNGAPMAGLAVNITTNDADNIVISNGVTAATYQVLTNSSGIATIKMTLPNTPGDYNIIIDIPGYPPKIIKASSVANLPVDVVVEGNNQDCGGDGCPASLPLPNPYKLRFLDINGNPVAGVVVKFSVVSGGGSLESSEDIIELERKSDAAGEVSVTHRLGKYVYNSEKVRIPQIVAVTGHNPGSELLLFESIASAGNPTTITLLENKATVRMTMGTATLNAIRLKVDDEFGNPVPGQELTVTPAGGLAVGTYVNGNIVYTTQTDANGEFIGVLVADFQGVAKSVIDIDINLVVGTIRYGVTGAVPTLDEFGMRIPDTAPHQLKIAIAGVPTAKVVTFSVDVDMGPRLVIVDAGVGLLPGTKQWVGKETEKPIIMMVKSYQRNDECDADVRDSIFDTDAGDWSDEDFSLSRIRSYSHASITVDYTARRSDNFTDDAPGLSATTVLMQTVVDGEFVPSVWTEPVTVTMTNAQGGIDVHATSRAFESIYRRDTVCLANGEPIYFDNLSAHKFSILSVADWPPMNNFLNLLSVSPQIEVIVNDQSFIEPNPDPFPLIRSHSGIDLSILNVSLNNQTIFGVSAKTANQYPNYIQAFLDGVYQDEVDPLLMLNKSPSEFKFIYYPTASELNFTGSNSVNVSSIKDQVGNTGADVLQTFTSP